MSQNVGLYVRVSTVHQARIDEGSLKSQKQKLDDWVKFQSSLQETEYNVVDTYEDVESGGTTARPEYLRMLSDIRTGRLNIVAATSISRLNRSLIDFYDLYNLCDKHNVGIISLKENFDTSSAVGRALLKLILVFYELEREQTAERVSDNIIARGKRGLWTTNYVLGYIPSEKAGYLDVDPIHSKTIQFIFDTYEQSGSIAILQAKLNEKGLKTAEIKTKSGNVRPQREFSDSTLRRILRNHVYIGKREVNKQNLGKNNSQIPEDKRYQITDGVWEPIIFENQFYKVQDILNQNYESRSNQVTKDRRNFILASLVICGECSSNASKNDAEMVPLVTGSGTSKTGKQYHYYICKNCKNIRLNASKLEKIVINRLAVLSENKNLIRKLIEETDKIVGVELPRIKNDLNNLKQQRQKLISDFDYSLEKSKLLTDNDAKLLLESKANEIMTEIRRIDDSMNLVEDKLTKKEGEKLNASLIQETLKNFSKIFQKLNGYEQQQLLKYVIDHVIVTKDKIQIAILGESYISPQMKTVPGKKFTETVIQRSGRDSNSQLPA